MSISAVSERPDSTRRFLLWALVGVLAGLVVLVLPGPGVLVVVAAAVVAGTRPGGATPLGGVLVGVGGPLLWLAYWMGSADPACTSGEITATGVGSCTERAPDGPSSGPWLLLAVVVIAAGVVLQVRARRRHAAEVSPA